MSTILPLSTACTSQDIRRAAHRALFQWVCYEDVSKVQHAARRAPFDYDAPFAGFWYGVRVIASFFVLFFL